jgi:hypothetical protein
VAFDEFVVAPARPVAGPTGDADPQEGSEGLRATARTTARSGLLAGADGVRLVGRAASLAGRPGALGAAAARWVDVGAQGLVQATRARSGPHDSPPGRWSAGSTGAGKPAGITHREDPGGCTVSARGARFTIDRATGHLVSWRIAGPDGRPRDVLAAPLRPNYWRALTDNDRGYGNIDARLQQVLVDTSWRDVAVRVVDAQVRSGREALEVRLQLDSPLFGDGLLAYRFREDGSVEVHHGLVPDREMYRLGVTTRLPEVDSVRWYGKGPHENHIDRNHGAFTAVHQLPLAELPHRYVRPQENGNRTEVRWVEAIGRHTVLRAEDLTGEHLGFTAWPWTQEALDAAEHDHELLAGPEVTLNLDRRQRGVGGDLPGMAALLPAYTIPAGQRHELRMRLSARVGG